MIAWRAVAALTGTDARQLATLVRNGMTLDFRAPRRVRERGGHPFLYTLVVHLVLNGLLAAVIAPRADALAFSFILLTLSIVNTWMAALVDFHTVLLSMEDLDIVGPRPVSGRTYAVSKLINFLIYSGLQGLAMGVGPAVVGGLKYGPGFGGLYLAAALLACLFAGSLVGALYSLLMGWVNLDRIRDALAYAQIGLTMGLLVLYQLVGRVDTLNLNLDAREFKPWMAAPPVWFAAVATLGGGEPSLSRLALAAVAPVSTFFLLLAPVRLMSFGYAERLAELAFTRRARPAPGALKAARPSPWRFGGVAGAVFGFCRRQAFRDRSIKTRALPMLVFPIFFLGMGFASDGVRDPFEVSGPQTVERVIFAILVPYFAIVAAVNCVYFLQTSEHVAASWIFRTSAGARAEDVVRGMLAFARYGVGLPILAVFATAMSVAWASPAHALAHTAFYWLQMEIAVAASAVALVHDHPASRPLLRGENWRFVLVYLAVMAGVGSMSAVQLLSYSNGAAVAAFAGGLVLVALGTQWIALKVVARRLRSLPDFSY